MIDMVVHRHQLRATLSRICRLLMDARREELDAAGEQGEGPESSGTESAEHPNMIGQRIDPETADDADDGEPRPSAE